LKNNKTNTFLLKIKLFNESLEYITIWLKANIVEAFEEEDTSAALRGEVSGIHFDLQEDLYSWKAH